MRIEYPERANDSVRRIQTMLDKLGLFEGQIDGSWGPVTREAVAYFSRQIGFAANSPNPSSVESASGGVITDVIIPDELLAELESGYNSRIEAESLSAREREERLRAEQDRLRAGTMLPPLPKRAPDSSGSLVLPVLVGGALVGLALWFSTRRRQSLITVPEIDGRMRADEVQF